MSTRKAKSNRSKKERMKRLSKTDPVVEKKYVQEKAGTKTASRDAEKHKQCDQKLTGEMNLEHETENEAKRIKERIERNKYTLDLVNLWINNVDNKISMTFAILSAILALIVFVTEDYLSNIESQGISFCSLCCVKGFALASGLLFLVSVLCFIMCIIPRFDMEKAGGKKYSIFYDEIKNFDNYRDYIDACIDANAEIFNQELEKEIYFNSCICSKKMRFFRKGIICSGLSILSAVVAALIYYIAVS